MVKDVVENPVCETAVFDCLKNKESKSLCSWHSAHLGVATPRGSWPDLKQWVWHYSPSHHGVSSIKRGGVCLVYSALVLVEVHICMHLLRVRSEWIECVCTTLCRMWRFSECCVGKYLIFTLAIIRNTWMWTNFKVSSVKPRFTYITWRGSAWLIFDKSLNFCVFSFIILNPELYETLASHRI
jgi:hypothetical protein